MINQKNTKRKLYIVVIVIVLVSKIDTKSVSINKR
jgi:hypothetical protein